jgi:hypothetical protein
VPSDDREVIIAQRVGKQMPALLNVGIVGCGAVVQAIHIPTVLRLPELWRITRVFDVDIETAAEAGHRVGATPSADALTLIADDMVDVVAICTPPSFHAEQVIAACESGKKAVLCEKPLCTSLEEARAIAEASRVSGVPVLTATMHAFDPAFHSGAESWGEARADLVESVCMLPPNHLYINQATQLVAKPSALQTGLMPASSPPERFRSAILGLASHHLPLVRHFQPTLEHVEVAESVHPWGYEVVLSGDGQVARLLGVITTAPGPSWTLSVSSSEARLLVDFPPSYVQAGSAEATLWMSSGAMQRWRYSDSGYVEEWRRLHELALGTRDGGRYVMEALADFELASTILSAFDADQGAA